MTSDGRLLPMMDPERATIPPASDPPAFERIAIVGLGAIGGSIALASRAAWPTALVIGVDANEALEQAVLRHAVDVGSSDLSILSGAHLVVLAGAADENARMVEQLPEHLQQAAVVTHVGPASVVLSEAAGALPSHLAFVGGHLMVEVAGPGIAHARPDLLVRSLRRCRGWPIRWRRSSGSPRPSGPAPVFASGREFRNRHSGLRSPILNCESSIYLSGPIDSPPASCRMMG